ncbi:MAG: DUF86 domain-containing protein [Acidobacteria bacterium]|nr:MAG: DUF86 domain-containing protein [Acidobacteriota bacterium]
MLPSDRVRLRHIAEALSGAIEFTRGRTRDQMATDRALAFAAARAIEIAGEAASKLSSEFRQQHPGIPWPQIIGMRNRLEDAYFDIDPDILWETAVVAAAELLPQILHLLAE